MSEKATRPRGLLKAAEEVREHLCVQACEGIPNQLLKPGVVLKLSSYLGTVRNEVEFLRNVRELQAAKIRALRMEVEGVAP